MGHSSLLGVDEAPRRPQGTDDDALGPSDGSDSGSDRVGLDTLPEADPGQPVDLTLGRDEAVAPIEGTGEDTGDNDASDIGTDQIVDAPDTMEQVLDDDRGDNARLQPERGSSNGRGDRADRAEPS